MDKELREKRWLTNGKRIWRVLTKEGYTSRQELVEKFDKNSDYDDIPGIGPVLGKQLKHMVSTSTPTQWMAVLGLPWDGTKEHP